MELIRHLNESCHHYSMRYCLRKDIIIYPRAISEYKVKLVLSYKGELTNLIGEYKSNPMYKKDKIWSEEIYKLYYIISIMENNKEKKNVILKPQT